MASKISEHKSTATDEDALMAEVEAIFADPDAVLAKFAQTEAVLA